MGRGNETRINSHVWLPGQPAGLGVGRSARKIGSSGSNQLRRDLPCEKLHVSEVLPLQDQSDRGLVWQWRDSFCD